ncbi:hypothetical protein [Psychrobacter aestuarii]|uniref:Uncharacterized protein n=1 Tax=Psychrobacter aestuarii TaxID=556327 RepID=A0ABN0VXQ7_9GAMM|nr:hypothetical protein [Psychrobacter aestuarii]
MSTQNAPVTKRQIVNRFLARLTSEDPQMYYASTSEVARQLYVMIKEYNNRLSVEEQAVVRGITSEQIESLLGFKER